MNLAEAKQWDSACKNPASDAAHWTSEPIKDAMSWLIAEVERLTAAEEHHHIWAKAVATEVGCADASTYRSDAIGAIRALRTEVKRMIVERDRYKSALDEFLSADNAYFNSPADSFDAAMADDRLIVARRNARELLAKKEDYRWF